MDPITIASITLTTITKAIEVYGRVQELRAKRQAGQEITAAELDALFADPALDYDAAINAEVDRRAGRAPAPPAQP